MHYDEQFTWRATELKNEWAHHRELVRDWKREEEEKKSIKDEFTCLAYQIKMLREQEPYLRE